MNLAFQTALRPNNKERTHLMKACGVARFAFNWGLAEWEKQYREFKAGERDKKPNGMALKKQFNAIKKRSSRGFTRSQNTPASSRLSI